MSCEEHRTLFAEIACAIYWAWEFDCLWFISVVDSNRAMSDDQLILL